jgi:hypothetical protein
MASIASLNILSLQALFQFKALLKGHLDIFAFSAIDEMVISGLLSIIPFIVFPIYMLLNKLGSSCICIFFINLLFG